MLYEARHADIVSRCLMLTPCCLLMFRVLPALATLLRCLRLLIWRAHRGAAYFTELRYAADGVGR